MTDTFTRWDVGLRITAEMRESVPVGKLSSLNNPAKCLDGKEYAAKGFYLHGWDWERDVFLLKAEKELRAEFVG